MVAVTYRRWSFTRGSNCKALTGKILVFWIGGCLWEVVAYERWSDMEIRLYLTTQEARTHQVNKVKRLLLKFSASTYGLPRKAQCLKRVPTIFSLGSY